MIKKLQYDKKCDQIKMTNEDKQINIVTLLSFIDAHINKLFFNQDHYVISTSHSQTFYLIFQNNNNLHFYRKISHHRHSQLE